jgi:hypothetical protein
LEEECSKLLKDFFKKKRWFYVYNRWKIRTYRNSKTL